jgi:putative transposase
MATTISLDLRVRIFEARADGESTAEVAERFAVSPAFVRRLLQRHRATGSLAPSSNPRGPQPRLAARADELRRLAAENPDLTPAEFRARLGAKVSELTVWRMLRRLGLTFKKSPSAPPSRTARTSRRRDGGGRNSSPRKGRSD